MVLKRYWQRRSQVFTLDKCIETVENEDLAHCNDSFRDITERKEAEKKIRKFNEELEHRVRVRTAELEKKTRDLERFNKLFVDRELHMVELKKRIKTLEKELAER
jgi:hypothetical protein